MTPSRCAKGAISIEALAISALARLTMLPFYYAVPVSLELPLLQSSSLPKSADPIIATRGALITEL